MNAISWLKVQDKGELGVKVSDKVLTFIVQGQTAVETLKKLTERIQDKKVATRTFEKIMEVFPIKEDSVPTPNPL